MLDQELRKQILVGDKKATRFFYQKYHLRLLNFVLRKIGKVEDAEEIVQNVFLDALDSLPFFKQKSSLSSWLCGIAKHEIADFYRKQKIRQIVFSKLPFLKKIADEALSPEFVLEKKEMQKRFYEVLKNLPEGFSQILRLKYIDSLSVSEIASQLNISYKAAESRLFRARLAYQKKFVQNSTVNQKNKQSLSFTRFT